MASYSKTPEAIAKLTPHQRWVTQEAGTERPGTGELLYNKKPGIYVDIVSGEPCSRRPTSTNPAAAGRALRSRSSQRTSTSCATPRTA